MNPQYLLKSTNSVSKSKPIIVAPKLAKLNLTRNFNQKLMHSIQLNLDSSMNKSSNRNTRTKLNRQNTKNHTMSVIGSQRESVLNDIPDEVAYEVSVLGSDLHF